MKPKLGGYTLIEALMVVAVSTTLFLGVATLFDGSQQDIAFSQAKVELETKIRAYVNEVSTGTFQGNTTYTCQRGTDGRPILTSPTTTAPKCVYLGKALQFIDDTSTVYVYDVLGLKNKHNGAVDTGEPATSYEDAMPKPAGELAGPGSNFEFLFVEEYRLPNDLKVVYSRVGSDQANILKIYSKLQLGSLSSRGVTAYSNDYQANSGDAYSVRLRQCIEEDTRCTTKYELETTGWDLCVESSDGDRRTKLNVKPTFSGITTTMTDDQC